MGMTNSDRPTLMPDFDLEEYTGESESKRSTSVVTMIEEEEEPASGVFLRFGSMTSVPRLVVPFAELATLPLDHRAGFLVSFIDGSYNVEMILDVCGMPADEALEILGDLATAGIIALD
jgi:hypothetical protein